MLAQKIRMMASTSSSYNWKLCEAALSDVQQKIVIARVPTCPTLQLILEILEISTLRHALPNEV